MALVRTIKHVAALALLVGALAAVACGSSEAAPETTPAANSPQEIAAELIGNDEALRSGIEEWRATGGDPPATPPPDLVRPLALLLQERVRFLAVRPAVADQTLALLPEPLRAEIRDLVAAARKLRRLSKGARKRKLKVGEPEPLAQLVSHYRKAEGRYGIGAHYLAAINLVETKFGRVKSHSTAGAQGPMQFIPSTWRIYGRGSISDPHDAIQAAARLLRDRGAPRSYAPALHAYNPSKLYVRAVTLYASLIARDRDAILFLYCWGP
jgi:membrane-bound lytic murein transglycosylase B